MLMNKTFISIIIPVFNQINRIKKCIDAVKVQSYGINNFEIIVVDNGSNDGSYEYLNSISNIILLKEESSKSPYVARNLGLSKAKSEIIVFLDINCVPCINWLSSGLEVMHSHNFDLVGGNVKFTLSKNSAAQIFDSISNVKMRDSIIYRNVAKGGNLFIKREVFNKLGNWPIERSGGDVKFTKKATDSGFKLGYSEKAYVNYPARGFISLIKKSFRVGSGIPNKNHLNSKRSKLSYFVGSLLNFPTSSDINNRILKRGNIIYKKKIFSLRLVGYCCQISTAFGVVLKNKI